MGQQKRSDTPRPASSTSKTARSLTFWCGLPEGNAWLSLATSSPCPRLRAFLPGSPAPNSPPVTPFCSSCVTWTCPPCRNSSALYRPRRRRFLAKSWSWKACPNRCLHPSEEALLKYPRWVSRICLRRFFHLPTICTKKVHRETTVEETIRISYGLLLYSLAKRATLGGCLLR